MNKFRVKRNMRFGKDNEYGPGDNVVLSVEEAAGFLDKLELVVDEGEVTAPSLDDATINKIADAGTKLFETLKQLQPPVTETTTPATDDSQAATTAETTDASTTPATDASEPATWNGLDAKIIASLEAAGVTPAMVPTLTDDELTAIDGIGPATLKKIRSAISGNAG